MRFTKREGHFKNREQALAEIASDGVAAPAGVVHRNVGADWHGIIAFPVHPSRLTQPLDKPVASRPSRFRRLAMPRPAAVCALPISNGVQGRRA